MGRRNGWFCVCPIKDHLSNSRYKHWLYLLPYSRQKRWAVHIFITLKFFGFAFLLCFFFGIANVKVARSFCHSCGRRVRNLYVVSEGVIMDSTPYIFHRERHPMGCVNYLLLYFVISREREKGNLAFAEAAAFHFPSLRTSREHNLNRSISCSGTT